MTATTPDTPAPATPPGAPRQKWLKIVLVVSLAANLLVIGTVVGAGIAFRRHHGPPPGIRGGDDFGMMGFTRTLEPARRDEIRKNLRAARKQLRSYVTEIEEARNQAADALAANPFSRDVLKTATGKVAEREARLKQEAVALFLDQAEKLTAEERKSLSDWWRKKRRRPRLEDRDGPPLGPPPEGETDKTPQ